MRCFATTVAAVLTSVACFNASIDPAGRFHRQLTFNSNWSSQEGLVIPADFDERLARVAHIGLISPPELVFLGSSRILLADSGLLEGVRTYNSGVSSASVEDLIALWQTLKENRKTPRYLVVFIDPWVFNKNSRLLSWRTNVRYCQAFAERIPRKDLAFYRIKARLLWNRALRELRLAELADLLSMTQLRSSIRVIRDRQRLRAEGPPAGSIVQLSALLPDDRAWRADGSYIYPAKMTREPALEDIRRISTEYALGEDPYYLQRYAIDEQAIVLFDEMLKDARRSNTQILLVSAPFQPTVLRVLSHRPAFREAIAAARRLVTKLAEDHGDVTTCDASDPADSQCAETEFMDGLHMLRPCVEKVLSRCVSRSRAWSALPWSFARSDGRIGRLQK